MKIARAWETLKIPAGAPLSDAKAAFIAWAMSVVFPHGMGTLEDIAARLDNKPSGLVPNTGTPAR